MASPLNPAGSVGAKAFNQHEIDFGMADNITERNVLRRKGQSHSPTLAANRLDQTAASKLMHDLH